MVWTQLLTLDGEHQICEPTRLRYRIPHVAGQHTRHARQVTLQLPAEWSGADAIHRAFERLQALPAHDWPAWPVHHNESSVTPVLTAARKRPQRHQRSDTAPHNNPNNAH
jgi:hypothetical protein